LREVVDNKPYIHNGFFPELPNIVMTYNTGMVKEISKGNHITDSKFSHKSGMIQKMNLTDDEVFDIVAFLKTLNSYKYKMHPPVLPKS